MIRIQWSPKRRTKGKKQKFAFLLSQNIVHVYKKELFIDKTVVTKQNDARVTFRNKLKFVYFGIWKFLFLAQIIRLHFVFAFQKLKEIFFFAFDSLMEDVSNSVREKSA